MIATIPGFSQTPLSGIMTQATIILIACSIVLSLMRDLYEDARGEQKPLLESRAAQRLRWFLKWFVVGLALYYLVLALSIGLIELTPNNGEDLIALQIPRSQFSARVSLKDVYIFATRAHFIIVVIVGMIVACAVRVRDQESRKRWKEAGR